MELWGLDQNRKGQYRNLVIEIVKYKHTASFQSGYRLRATAYVNKCIEESPSQYTSMLVQIDYHSRHFYQFPEPIVDQSSFCALHQVLFKNSRMESASIACIDFSVLRRSLLLLRIDPSVAMEFLSCFAGVKN
jgi:hypothetical protein